MKPVKTDVSFPRLEESTLAHWREHGIEEKGLKANTGKDAFVFYDGPPFATGLPHYGHILAGTLKDIVPRYWVMKGKYVERRWGWDCHGLPVEFEMEKELGLAGRTDIEKMGIAKFNEACRGIVLRYTKEWQDAIRRTGRWADWNAYRTMDKPYMESVWWVVKQLFDQGLVYEGHRVMPYSWRISTPLSNFEASLNYQEVQDPALTVKFREVGGKGRVFLAWTTTPWTLPSNLALSVNPDEDYVQVGDYVAGKAYAEAHLPGEKSAPFKGATLEGVRYEPLFPYFKTQKDAFRILLGAHVTATDGTGIVHTAPAFGEDDFEVCKKYGIELVDPVDSEGKFTSLVPEYAGQNIKDADKNIIRDLKARDAIFRHDTYVHNYPFCWRSETPLIYKAISTWFVKLDPLKKRLVENNTKTRWVPEHLRDGRFGNWLEAARDWNISRNRFWGTPIPIWRAEDGELHCVGSAAELEKLSGRKLDDLHKHFIDDIEIKSPKTGKPMRRIPEVLDCWFESGSMPYAQCHYPFENKEKFEKNFPAHFIAEGIDQTRGWFYTLSVLGTALFDKAPFQNVIVNGLVLAEDGKKMSKRLKNYPDPAHVLDTYGADALRAYLMSSPASHAEEMRFTEAGVKEVVRSVILPLWNAYSFLVTYTLAEKMEQDAMAFEPPVDAQDRWIVSRLHSLIRDVDEKMAVYHLYEVIPLVLHFIEELTNWYIRLNRRRFWESDTSAYKTLYYVLTRFTRVLAPILPFVTDEIYRNLEGGESVHLAEFPAFEKKYVDTKLEKQMELVERVVEMGRRCRETNKLKTRQPLREMLIITKNPEDRGTIESFQQLLAAELNVKSVGFTSDEAKFVSLLAKPNAKVLGPRLGTKMKAVMQKIKELTPDAVAKLEATGSMEIEGEKILSSDIEISRQPKQEGLIQTSGGVTVFLDTKLDQALVEEGQAREFVNRVQKLRKDLGFDVSDRIRIAFHAPPALRQAFRGFGAYITSETLAVSLAELSGPTGPFTAEQDIDGLPIQIRVEKAE